MSNYKFYSGISGLALPIPRYQFPPPFEKASRLTYYASIFNSIEINSSFYRLPNSKTISKWKDSVPGNFRFTFKLWKEISHVKNLSYNIDQLHEFMNAIAFADDKKGCLIIQLPPSCGFENFYSLNSLVETINKNYNDWKVAVEFRNNSWYREETFEMLLKHNSTCVMHDISKSTFLTMLQGSDFAYLRFHGPEGNYRGSYDETVLNDYAELICQWLSENTHVYVYFNNTMGNAFENLKQLNSYVESKI